MTALAADLDDYLVDYNYDRAHTGRLTNGAGPRRHRLRARKTSISR